MSSAITAGSSGSSGTPTTTTTTTCDGGSTQPAARPKALTPQEVHERGLPAHVALQRRLDDAWVQGEGVDGAALLPQPPGQLLGKQDVGLHRKLGT